MRPLEIILVTVDALTVILVAIPRLRAAGWALYASLVAALAAIAQLLVEGPRWQMLPAYALTALLLVICLVVRWLPAQQRAPSVVQHAILGLAFTLLAVALIVSGTLPLAIPMFHFPEPTGPFAIGTLTYHWVDRNRADFGDPSAPRELMVQIWYPAAPSPQAEHDTYIQDDMHFGSLPGTRFPGLFSNHLKDVRTHAFKAAVAAEGEPFPLLLFSPGAEGFRQHNTFQVEELVSHGYVVAGIDHPRAAREVVFPDGRRVEYDPSLVDIPRFFSDPKFGEGVFNYLGQDASFALDQLVALNGADPNGILTGRLDIARAGMFGVSLGGLVTAEACRNDQRLRACLIQDVFVPEDVIAAGLRQPLLILTRDKATMLDEGWPEWEAEMHLSTMRAAFEGARSDSYFATVAGMFHLNYTDFPYTLATPLARSLGFIGPIDWRRGHEIVNAYTLAFFDRHLAMKAAPLLDGPAAQFPEVVLESRQP